MNPLALSLIALSFLAGNSALGAHSDADSPRAPADTKAIRKEQAEIKALIVSAKEKRDDVDSRFIEYKNISDDPSSSAEDKLRAFEAFRDERNGLVTIYQEVLIRTANLYNVHPRSRSLTVAKSTDPNLAWSAGLVATWDPMPLESGPNRSVVVSIPDPLVKGKYHYYGQKAFDPAPLDPEKDAQFAVTTPDGRIFVAMGAIDLAIERGHNLGFIASILFHEAQHFNQLNRMDCPSGATLPCGWTQQEIDERDAFRDQSQWSRTFGLSKKDSENFAEQWRIFDDAINSGKPLTMRGLTPRQEAAWKPIFDATSLEVQYARLKHDVLQERAKELTNTAIFRILGLASRACDHIDAMEDESAEMGDLPTRPISRAVLEAGMPPNTSDCVRKAYLAIAINLYDPKGSIDLHWLKSYFSSMRAAPLPIPRVPPTAAPVPIRPLDGLRMAADSACRFPESLTNERFQIYVPNNTISAQTLSNCNELTAITSGCPREVLNRLCREGGPRYLDRATLLQMARDIKSPPPPDFDPLPLDEPKHGRKDPDGGDGCVTPDGSPRACPGGR